MKICTTLIELGKMNRFVHKVMIGRHLSNLYEDEWCKSGSYRDARLTEPREEKPLTLDVFGKVKFTLVVNIVVISPPAPQTASVFIR